MSHPNGRGSSIPFLGPPYVRPNGLTYSHEFGMVTLGARACSTG